MGRTFVRSDNIGDGEVKRADVNTTTPGSALITKVVVGSGIYLESSGADEGTGDVKIFVRVPLVVPIFLEKVTWDFPNVLTELLGKNYYRVRADLSKMMQYRLVVNCIEPGIHQTACLYGQYSTDQNNWFNLYSQGSGYT